MSFLRKKLRRSTSQSSTRSVSRMSTASDVEIDRLSMSSFVFDSGVKPWSEIVDKKKASKMSSSEKKRQQVLYELFTTEKSYLRDLYVIKKLFQKSVALDNCCTDEEIQTLFGNLDEVLLVNGELYESLKSRRHDGVCSHIGDIFISLLKESKFDVYIEFCAGQTEAIELYEHLNRNNSEFSQTMRTCEQKVEESGGFNLPAFLLKGMQRLLKYQPLLSQVLKSTPKEDLEYRQLQKAIELMNKVAFKVNEKVRESELKRRLPQLESLVIPDMLRPWVGRPKFDTNFTRDPSRLLLQEGPLKLVRPLLSDERKYTDVYVILLSDLLLVTHEREGKYHLRDTKEIISVIKVTNITDIQTEITPVSRDRTTFHIEVSAPSRIAQPAPASVSQLVKDSPRAVVRDPEKRYFRFEVDNPTHLKSWVVNLYRARDVMAKQNTEVNRKKQNKFGLPDDEFAVTLLVSTQLEADSDTNEETVKAIQENTPDWEITFESADEANGVKLVETTRHVRVIQGEYGLGMTLIGCNPVTIQEVDPDGSAFACGLRAGDAIRAVNGTDCMGLAHEEVITLIRACLLDQRQEWNPVSAPLDPVPTVPESEIAEAAVTRGTKKMMFLMDI
eukprot:m.50499 g.50499  ORF g.50499 m.50499 type:complete len:615 (-) comp10888_c0_seq3:1782-3626(-)